MLVAVASSTSPQMKSGSSCVRPCGGVTGLTLQLEIKASNGASEASEASIEESIEESAGASIVPSAGTPSVGTVTGCWFITQPGCQHSEFVAVVHCVSGSSKPHSQ